MEPRFTIPRFVLPPFVARLGARLPQWPHSLSLVAGLNIAARLGVLPAETLSDLEGHRFRVSVLDSGTVADFTVQGGIFKPILRPSDKPDLHFSANLSAFLQLMTRQEDPDTLFFNRQLTIEGDTELGLRIKNMLDAIEWSRLPIPAPLRARLGLSR